MTDTTKPKECEQVHEEKETLAVDLNLPGHEERTTTALFTRSKHQLIERKGGAEHARCFICNATAAEAGQPLEAHHHPIERSLANLIDWSLFKQDMGSTFHDFDWSKFDPAEPLTFVDDMTVNGILLCKKHHTGKDEGIHMLPYPLWIAQKWAKEGYQFSAIEVIHHAT